MTGLILEELVQAASLRRPCVLVTVAATKGSVPRRAGTRMIVYPDGTFSGTVGGGKFEDLVIREALSLPRRSLPLLKTWPLHEAAPDSFGAICGGEMTVLLDPQFPPPAVTLAGAGHCSQALAKLAQSCGWHVTVLDDRVDLLRDFPAAECVGHIPATEYIAGKAWEQDDALVLLNRNFQLDRDALAAALANRKMGYLGMIGSQRKVRRVHEDLLAAGFSTADLDGVHAPAGLDLGADHPAEIAVSIFAEILCCFNKTSARPMSLPARSLTVGPSMDA